MLVDTYQKVTNVDLISCSFFLFTFIKLALIQTNVIVDELKKLWPNTSFEIGELFLFLFHLHLLGSFIFELNQM